MRQPLPPARPRLAAACAERGISYRLLAAEVGVHEKYISQIIQRGTADPSPDLKKRIAAYLGLPVRRLFDKVER